MTSEATINKQLAAHLQPLEAELELLFEKFEKTRTWDSTSPTGWYFHNQYLTEVLHELIDDLEDKIDDEGDKFLLEKFGIERDW